MGYKNSKDFKLPQGIFRGTVNPSAIEFYISLTSTEVDLHTS